MTDHVTKLREMAYVSPPRKAEEYSKGVSCAYLLELADEIEWLRAERNRHIDYEIDLQRIIEDLCHDRDIREPKTPARYHYNMAVKFQTKDS